MTPINLKSINNFIFNNLSLVLLIISTSFYFFNWMSFDFLFKFSVNGINPEFPLFSGVMNEFGYKYFISGTLMIIIHFILIGLIYLDLFSKNDILNKVKVILNVVLIFHPLYFLYFYIKLDTESIPRISVFVYLLLIFYLLSLLSQLNIIDLKKYLKV